MRSAGHADDVEILQPSCYNVCQDRREYLDVVVREDDLFAFALMDSPVVRFGQRAGVLDADYFGASVGKKRAIHRRRALKFGFVDAGNDDRGHEGCARIAGWFALSVAYQTPSSRT